METRMDPLPNGTISLSSLKSRCISTKRGKKKKKKTQMISKQLLVASVSVLTERPPSGRQAGATGPGRSRRLTCVGPRSGSFRGGGVAGPSCPDPRDEHTCPT